MAQRLFRRRQASHEGRLLPDVAEEAAVAVGVVPVPVMDPGPGPGTEAREPVAAAVGVVDTGP
jgi:hypothetical protein